ncbi:MAG: hypothetical protein ABSF73_01105 [Terriglobia bacterium]
MRAGLGSQESGFKWWLVLLLAALYALFLNPRCWPPVHAAGPAPYGAGAGTNVQQQPTGVVRDTPAITVASATADTASTPTTTAHEAQIQWTFGTVTGNYTTCTAQAKTSYGGSTWLTLGSAVSLTVTTGAVNAWTILEEVGTGSVTTSAVSSTAALGFGQATKFTFACSGGYGTSAPVTVSVIYK